MKYFIYSFIWRVRGEDGFKNAGTGIIECESLVEVYEHAIMQPEVWALTHCAEITKEEYDEAKKKGTIG
jgi:hypothetical protein